MGDPFSDTKLKVCLSRGCAHQHLGRTVDLTWECEVSITRKDGRACDVFDQESRGLPLHHDDILQRLPMPCSLVYDNLHALVRIWLSSDIRVYAESPANIGTRVCRRGGLKSPGGSIGL